MKPAILVINCGSSSIKFAVIAPETGEVFLSGIAERLGDADGQMSVKYGDKASEIDLGNADHAQAMDRILVELDGWLGGGAEVVAVGHRVVHGGEAFSGAASITPEVIESIEACSTLAPLHNPMNLLGIRAVQASRPELPQVAVFDTAFHQTLPEQAYLYAIPYKLYEEASIRRYGFHGTSHQYVAQAVAKEMDKPLGEIGIVTLHLGNGCSACAIQGGMSVDTTMGLSPLEGMAMGTRSGNVDPDLPRFLNEQQGMAFSEISKMLNKESGLLGLSGTSNDMRTLSEAAEGGDMAAKRAIDVFCYRAAKAVMEMAVALDHLDAVVFTGGIGENARGVRAQIIQNLRVLGFEVSQVLNQQVPRGVACCISTERSRSEVWVVPTNEELMIAQQTFNIH
ncbi:MAG: acetate/propionate family kinase [Opitutales bacterium]